MPTLGLALFEACPCCVYGGLRGERGAKVNVAMKSIKGGIGGLEAELPWKRLGVLRSGPGEDQGRKDGGPASGIFGSGIPGRVDECSRVPGDGGPGADGPSPRLPAVKPWKPKTSPQRRVSHPGPAPVPTLAQPPCSRSRPGTSGAAGDSRGANEVSRPPQLDGGSKPGGQTLGALQGHSERCPTG